MNCERRVILTCRSVSVFSAEIGNHFLTGRETHGPQQQNDKCWTSVSVHLLIKSGARNNNNHIAAQTPHHIFSIMKTDLSSVLICYNQIAAQMHHYIFSIMKTWIQFLSVILVGLSSSPLTLTVQGCVCVLVCACASLHVRVRVRTCVRACVCMSLLIPVILLWEADVLLLIWKEN